MTVQQTSNYSGRKATEQLNSTLARTASNASGQSLFGDKKVFNYTLNGEQYSFDPISPDAVVTTNIAWQYSDVNVVAVHHALLTSGLPVSEVDIVCTLPLTEYYDRNNQPNTENIERKKANFRKKITLNGGDTFTIKDVKVMPESIPAGYEVLQELDELDSLLIIDLGAPH